VETIVQGLVKARVARDAAIVAQLLRLQFHECAVNVCMCYYSSVRNCIYRRRPLITCMM
jgi:hypothetical protein